VKCLFLADIIGNRKEELLEDFKSKVCSCLGCCGDGRCFYHNQDENWMAYVLSLLDTACACCVLSYLFTLSR